MFLLSSQKCSITSAEIDQLFLGAGNKDGTLSNLRHRNSFTKYFTTPWHP